MDRVGGPRKGLRIRHEGFSLIELLVSVSLITILMAMVFQFMSSNQQRYRSQQLFAEVIQGGRSAFEVIAQELHQAGYNPPFETNKTVGTSPPAATGQVVSLPVSGGGTTPVTRRIFYGSRLVIGNTCSGTSCNQEEVVVNNDVSYGTTAITTTAIPVAVTNTHSANEPIYSRNYPYPAGILFDNRTASATPQAFADNKFLFFGDIMDTGDIYYGEYRLRCGTLPSNYVDACTGSCTAGPFTLTRFVTKLADSNGVFRIPTSKATVYDGAVESPLVGNIQGTCPALPGTSAPTDWIVAANYPDETSSTGTTNIKAAITWSPSTSYVQPMLNSDGTPALWVKMNTYGASPYFQSFVLDVRITLTIQQSQIDPETRTYRLQRLQTHIVPRNINNALAIAGNGGSAYLPPIPIDIGSTGCTATTPITCPSLPLGTFR